MIELPVGGNVYLKDMGIQTEHIILNISWKTPKLAAPQISFGGFMMNNLKQVNALTDFVGRHNNLSNCGTLAWLGGDDAYQAMRINLNHLMQSENKRIVFLVYAQYYQNRKLTFRYIDNVKIQLFDEDLQCLVTHDIPKSLSANTIVCAELYLYQGKIKFKACHHAYQDGLLSLTKHNGWQDFLLNTTTN